MDFNALIGRLTQDETAELMELCWQNMTDDQQTQFLEQHKAELAAAGFSDEAEG